MSQKFVEQIMESFKGMIPEEKVSTVEEAVQGFIKETETKIQKEYEQTLEESYKEWQEQTKKAEEDSKTKLEESEKTAYEGYDQAKVLLQETEGKVDKQKEEFESFLEEQYSVAKTMLDDEKGRNDKIEEELYESYMQQLEDVKEDLVAKIDDFLTSKTEQIVADIRKELKNDPDVLESKVAYDRIKDIVASSLKSEDIESSTAGKIDVLEDSLSQLQAEIKTLKAKNMRLHTEKVGLEKKVDEALETKEQIITEEMQEFKTKTERRIVEKNAKFVEGRGTVLNEDIIKEEATTKVNPDEKQVDEVTGMDKAVLKQLAGI